MIPPHYFAAQLQAAQRRVREGIQAVPTMDPDGTAAQQPDGYFNDCVLDLSRYLTSSDLPATPREFFDDLFHEKSAAGAENSALDKPLSAHHHGGTGVIKVKEEPDSTATSRCSTPESLLPEHDFDNGEFPTPKFSGGNESGVLVGKEKPGSGSLMCQLQSIQQNSSGNHGNIVTLNNNNHSSNNNNNNNKSTNNNTDADSNDSNSDVEMDMENLDINAQKLKAALAQLKHNNNNNNNSRENEYRLPGGDSRDGSEGTGDAPTTPVDGLPSTLPHLPQQSQQPHKNPLKSPRSKSRKAIEKGTDEYIVKRERNNVAVRKSRTKAKLKHIETQMRVGELTEENEQLRNRVASLQKELNALKSFISYNCPGNVKPPCFSSSTSYPPQQIFSTKIM